MKLKIRNQTKYAKRNLNKTRLYNKQTHQCHFQKCFVDSLYISYASCFTSLINLNECTFQSKQDKKVLIVEFHTIKQKAGHFLRNYKTFIDLIEPFVV